MAIGQYPEGAYRLESDEWVTRGSGRISDYLNPAVELLVDRQLPLKALNRFWGSMWRPGQILSGVDVIASIARIEMDELGYYKPVVTICNGTGSVVTESNGYTRAANMKPVGTFFQHCYNWMDDRLVDRLRPAIDRGQYLCVPYIKDPYYADQVWVGAATGGSVTSAGGANLNTVGQAYSADYRLSVNYVMAAGDYVQSDHNGHFMKWIPNTTSAATLEASLQQRIGQVLYVEELPMRGLLQTVMLKATNGLRRMYSDYDFMQPYPTPSGKDPRTFLQADKSFWPTNYGEIDEYGWPEHLHDFMGIPGLTDGVRMASTEASETFINVAVGVDGFHSIQLTNHPIQRSEAGSVNKDDTSVYDRFPSKLKVEWDTTGAGTFVSGTVATLIENIDYKVNRHTGLVTILQNRSLAGQVVANGATDDYRTTYMYLKDQVYGVPTNVDWKGSVGLVYICTNFNKS